MVRGFASRATRDPADPATAHHPPAPQVHLTKPEWVTHAESEAEPVAIFSVDVHPDGTRFATAGNDVSIKLWSLKPCVDEEAEADAAAPKLLATLAGHSGAVNCVRWSADGKWLASCSDDHMVMLWRKAAAGERLGAMPFGSAKTVAVERWRSAQTLHGHSGDVVGVAWSPCSGKLASVSLDNSVRVWDVSGAGSGAATQPAVAVLSGHHGMAKGVAWDPIGRYVVSQGDDRAVIFWETREWSEAGRCEKPFERSSQKTLFRRLGWSPDGQYLACPHAYKKPAHLGIVLKRPAAAGEPIVDECDFVGHSSPVVCTQFNGRVFKRPAAAAGGKETIVTCCALGSQDCNLSVWLTSSPRPLVVVRKMFEQDVLDISWVRRPATPP